MRKPDDVTLIRYDDNHYYDDAIPCSRSLEEYMGELDEVSAATLDEFIYHAIVELYRTIKDLDQTDQAIIFRRLTLPRESISDCCQEIGITTRTYRNRRAGIVATIPRIDKFLSAR